MYNYYDLANVSLVKASSNITEIYYPLWVYSSGSASVSGNSYSSPGQTFLMKGSTSVGTTTSSILHTLNSNWVSSQKFALEISSYTTGSFYAALWDKTANSIVSASQFYASSSSTPLLVRSGQFTLTPGHSYGVTAWLPSGNMYGYINKAHLIAFMS